MNEEFSMESWLPQWNQASLSKDQKYQLLKLLFKYQLKRMEYLRYDLLMPQLDTRSVYRLAKMKDVVLKRAIETGQPGLLPFLPVLPRKVVTTFNVVSRLYSVGEQWEQTISLDKVDKGEETSPHRIPYFIFNVDIGWGYDGLSPNSAIEMIREMKMHPMNLAEALALQMHANVLKNAFIHACGSKYRNAEHIPGIDVDKNGRFRLVRNLASVAKPGWISPSYQSDVAAISWRGIISPKALFKWRNRGKGQPKRDFVP